MFTPGDDSRGWSLDYDQDGDASQNGGSSAHMILAADATPVAIAMVPYPFAADDILDANGRLIAAAPELLSALSALLFNADHGNGLEALYAARENARKAIFKATGHEQC
jgi:DNA-binding transcriptional LysR family regulator